jgi:hypothetical protein
MLILAMAILLFYNSTCLPARLPARPPGCLPARLPALCLSTGATPTCSPSWVLPGTVAL